MNRVHQQLRTWWLMEAAVRFAWGLAQWLAVGLTVLGKALDVPLPVALALTAAFPLVLLLLGFYLPAERRRLRRLLPILGR